MDWTIAEIFGITAFFAHTAGYLWYAYGIFHEKIRPNVAACFMWLTGNWIEYAMYEALPGSHWSSSVPLVCAAGMTLIFFAIALSVARAKRNARGITYHSPDPQDWFLVAFDLIAVAVWIYFKSAEWASLIAISTSVITYIPVWRTTLSHPEKEHAGPWVLWCVAYIAMFVAVIFESREGVGWRSFYPLYYGVLSIVVVALLQKGIRERVLRFIRS